MMFIYVFGVVVLLVTTWLVIRFRDFERREDEFFRHLRGEFSRERSPVRLYAVRDGRRSLYVERPGGPYDRELEDGV